MDVRIYRLYFMLLELQFEVSEVWGRYNNNNYY